MDSTYLIKHPKDKVFYKIIAFLMGVMALNSESWQWFEPPKHVFYTIHRKAMLALVPVSVFLQFLYIPVHFRELDMELILMLFTICFIAAIVLLKFLLAQTNSYKTVMEDFMKNIHLYSCYTNDRQHYVGKIMITAEKLSHWSSFYYMFLCYVCCTSFETVPIIYNFQKIESYSNITFRLGIIVHMWLPFDYEFDFTNWVIVQTIMVYIGFLAITYLVLFDTVNMAILYHIIGHIVLFKDEIKIKFHNNKSKISQEKIKGNLIDATKTYIFITRTLKNVEAAFGLNIASIYMFNLVGGGLFIYQIMNSGNDTGTTLITFGLLIPIYMGILIIISFALEGIRIVADDIPDLIYGINWESMSVSNQKMVMMLLIQVQPTLQFNAAFKIKTGVQPAINIIKTTFSYYVMLKSTVKSENY